jgi:hypothetical protein
VWKFEKLVAAPCCSRIIPALLYRLSADLGSAAGLRDRPRGLPRSPGSPTAHRLPRGRTVAGSRGRRFPTLAALRGVECDNLDRVPVFAAHQVGDGGLEIGGLDIGFPIGPAVPAE